MKLLIVAGTNLELYYLSSVVSLLKSEGKSLEFKLLLREIFKDNITPEIRSLYSEVDLFEIPALTPPISKNPIKTIGNFIDNFSQYLKFRKYIKKVLSDIDVVCICGFKEFFASVLCRLAPKKVRLVALRLANQRLEEETDFIRKPILSFFLNIKNFLFGCSTMDYKWRIDLKNELATKSFVRYPYHRTISVTDYNIGEKDSNYRLPPPFVALKGLYEKNEEEPAILLAGDKTPAHKNWDKEDQMKYEGLFDYLRKNFKDYKLYFKPKMGKTDPSKYNLDGFELIDSKMSLEEVCLRKNIKKLISIRSTSSKVAVYFGIPGYFTYPLFKFPEEMKKLIENEHDDIRSVIRVNKYEDLMKEPELFIEKYNFNDLSVLYWNAIIQ